MKCKLTSSQEYVAKLFDKVSSIYQNGFVYEEKFREQFKNGYLALKVFLDTYAYARQGAAAAYPQIACECISRKFKDGKKWNRLTKSDAKLLWDEYQEIAKLKFNLFNKKTQKAKVNEDRNPMNRNKGVILKLASNNIENIAVYVRELINEGQTHEAHDFMQSIKGIGEKIASFYLRDIAYFAKIDEDRIKDDDLCLLQPIDTWLEQIVKILFKPEVLKSSLRAKQKLIVDLCKGIPVSCINFNQGAWLFGSQIAEEFGKLQKALTNIDKTKSIIEEYIIKKERHLDEVKKVLEILRNQQEV